MHHRVASFARALPKIELHLHLDGSLSQEFIGKRAAARGIDLAAEFGPGFTDVRSALHGLKVAARGKDASMAVTAGSNWGVFDWVNRFLQTHEELERGTVDVVSQLAVENVRYAEVRFCPSLHCREGLSERDSVQAVVKGFEAAREATGVIGGVILCVLRSMPADHGMRVARLAAEFLGQGVCEFLALVHVASRVCPAPDQ